MHFCRVMPIFCAQSPKPTCLGKATAHGEAGDDVLQRGLDIVRTARGAILKRVVLAEQHSPNSNSPVDPLHLLREVLPARIHHLRHCIRAYDSCVQSIDMYMAVCVLVTAAIVCPAVLLVSCFKKFCRDLQQQCTIGGFTGIPDQEPWESQTSSHPRSHHPCSAHTGQRGGHETPPPSCVLADHCPWGRSCLLGCRR